MKFRGPVAAGRKQPQDKDTAGITCFDGVDCIGGNKILLEDEATKAFFEFGKDFRIGGSRNPKMCPLRQAD